MTNIPDNEIDNLISSIIQEINKKDVYALVQLTSELKEELRKKVWIWCSSKKLVK